MRPEIFNRLRSGAWTTRAPVPAGDVAVGIFLVAIVAMVIVPLPTPVLDGLIALNIAVSLGLLLVALYVAEPSHLAALPSLLLLATLFRLGLNISTTRLVLLNGDAGRIVEAFGRVVVGGNIVVGAVVFLVMALVQFIVIAKGSERVAEVAARFTLDALPGKQMSIDADLRSGTLSLEHAQARRRALERESQLYGALDGAMKFVKGDAVAGLVIVAINIVGGLAIGVTQRGMSIGAAASHYTVLTVGDGLVAQLPSLFVSTTAGLVVTRVPGESADGNLGGDITAQIAAQPRALAIAGVLLVLIAGLPGLPTVPFLMLGGVAGFAAVASHARRRPDADSDRHAAASELDPAVVLKGVAPIHVRLGESGYEWVERTAERSLTRQIGDVRLEIAGTLGVRLPEIAVSKDTSLPTAQYSILSDGIAIATGDLPEDACWIDAPPQELKPFGIDARERPSPIGPGALAWSDAGARNRAASAGYRTGDRADLVRSHLERVVSTLAPEFIGVQETRDLVDALESTHPALVAEVIPRLLPLSAVADVLRRLVAERVSIRDLRAIVEALATAAQHDPDPVALTEAARRNLRRQITHAATGGRRSLPVYLISRRLETMFREAIRFSVAGGPVALEPALAQHVIDQLHEFEQIARAPTAQTPVLLVASDIRRHVRALIESDLPDVQALSFHELLPDVTIQPIATLDEAALRL